MKELSRYCLGKYVFPKVLTKRCSENIGISQKQSPAKCAVKSFSKKVHKIKRRIQKVRHRRTFPETFAAFFRVGIP